MIPILYEDDRCVVVDKPRTFHVHPPETRDDKVPRSKILLYVLRDQLNTWMYPVHRLDVGTTGVLVMAKDAEAASMLSKEFQKKEVEKIYWSVVRGFLPDHGEIDLPLQSDSSGEMIPCFTGYKALSRTEIQQPVGKRFSSARYTWAEVRLGSGRFHQIRRHFNRISHPVIGDAQHGDSHHNRFFRETLMIRGLCLRAIRLKFFCPWKNEELRLEAPLDHQWKQVQDLFGLKV